jgi:SAM-dependent methyltransferase
MLRHVDSDLRYKLRTTFDLEAARYDRVRPVPPATLVDAILEQGHLKAGDRVLEVGCGTGQATRPLAERGLKVHALELGPQMAALARRNLQGLPDITVQTTAFELFKADEPFDALVSVQAFHWVGPERGLELAAAALRSGGYLLLAWHQGRPQDPAFLRDTDPIYARYPEPPRPTPSSAPEQFEMALAASPDFTSLRTSHYPWRQVYNKRNYLDLLLTFSDVQALGEAQRQSFLREIGEVLDRHGGETERYYEGFLLTAMRR